jgi:hypothetical protein
VSDNRREEKRREEKLKRREALETSKASPFSTLARRDRSGSLDLRASVPP